MSGTNDFCSVPTLPDAVLDSILSFVGNGNYRYIAGTNRHFRRAYESNRNRTKKTKWYEAAASVSCADFVLEDYRLLGKSNFDVEKALKRIVSRAIERANVDVLKWAQQHGYEIDSYGEHTFLGQNECFLSAGRNGHASVLDWLDSASTEWIYKDLLYGALDFGNADTLTWLHGSHNHLHVLQDPNHQAGMLYYAREYGHAHIFQWMKDNLNLMPNIAEETWIGAAVSGHLSMLDWLEKNDPDRLDHRNEVAYGAVYSGSIPVLEWVKDHGVVFHRGHCAKAADGRRGCLDALKWLRENGCPWDGMVIRNAIKWRHNHILEWARANGCPESEFYFEPDSESESESDDDH